MYVCQLGADLPNLAVVVPLCGNYKNELCKGVTFIANSKNLRGARDLRGSSSKRQLEFTPHF